MKLRRLRESAYKLDVNGSTRATEITVNATGADFVFELTLYMIDFEKKMSVLTRENEILKERLAAVEEKK